MKWNKDTVALPILILGLLLCVVVTPAEAKSKAEATVAQDAFGQEMSALRARHSAEIRALKERQRAEKTQLLQRYGKVDDSSDNDFYEDKSKEQERSKGKEAEVSKESKGKGGDKGKMGKPGKE